MVEQNARAALQILERGFIIETGSIVLEGEASKLLIDENIKKAYLGY
jgi:branched-chain amino acid transport system ATP-binding protein